jgi:hypothetical protein
MEAQYGGLRGVDQTAIVGEVLPAPLADDGRGIA